MPCDLYLFACYIAPKPERHTHDVLRNADVWDCMLEHIGTALCTGQVLVLGDLNAHTGTEPDYTDAEAAAEEELHSPVFDMLSTRPVSTAR